MAKSPKENIERLEKSLQAWKTLRPDKSFGGISLADFEALVVECRVPRTTLLELKDEGKQQATIRNAKDKFALKELDRVVNGILSDKDEGEDSAIYEAFGYIRKSDRKSGLTRKKETPK